MRTIFQANRELNAMFGKHTSLIIPSVYYVGLSTSPIYSDGQVFEPKTTQGYYRVAIANNASSFNTAENGVTTNSVSVEFGEPTSDWGNIAGYFIADAKTGGNVLWFENFTDEEGNFTTKQVLKSDILTIGTKRLTITFE